MRSIVVVALSVFAAYAILQYFTAAFAYSATLGVTSRLSATRLAEQRAWGYLILFWLLEVFSTAMVVARWPEPDLGTRMLRFLARYGTGMLISLTITGIATGACYS